MMKAVWSQSNPTIVHGGRYERCIFANNFGGAQFEGVSFRNCVFAFCNFDATKFDRCYFFNCTFKICRLDNVIFFDTRLDAIFVSSSGSIQMKATYTSLIFTNAKIDVSFVNCVVFDFEQINSNITCRIDGTWGSYSKKLEAITPLPNY